MSPRNIDGVILESDGGKGATELVRLHEFMSYGFGQGYRLRKHIAKFTYPVNQSPIPTFHQERKLSKQPTEQAVLEDDRIRG